MFRITELETFSWHGRLRSYQNHSPGFYHNLEGLILRKRHRSRATVYIRATTHMCYLLESLSCARQACLLWKPHSLCVQLRIHVCNIATDNVRCCSRLRWAFLSSKKAPDTGAEDQKEGCWEYEFPQDSLPFFQLTLSRNHTLPQPCSLIPCLAPTIMPAQHPCRWISFSRKEFRKWCFSSAMLTIPPIRGKKPGTDILQGHASFSPDWCSLRKRVWFLRSQWEL